MQQSSLHSLFLGSFRHIHLFKRVRVKPRVKHRGRYRSGRGIKVLHLLWMDALLFAEQRKLHGVFQRAARVRAHQIRHNVLIFIFALCQRIKLIAKALVAFDMRLAHLIEHRRRTMLGSDAELTADMIAHKLLKELVAFVLHQVIEADTAADEHFFNAVKVPEFSKQIKIILMAYLHLRAGLWRKAFFALAKSEPLLLFAGRQPEIRRRTADVAYVAFKALVLQKALRFFYYAFLASDGHCTSLMERQ